ncbi:MAG: lytic transglycosylase domain-containing protein [Burkholderiaceae bacterium]
MAGWFLAALALGPGLALGGAQQYEPLSVSVKTALSASISDAQPPRVPFENVQEHLAYLEWLAEMSNRLKGKQPNFLVRRDLLETVYYEAKRAGLEPALMLGLIQVESNFRKYAVSSAGARGLTQVMPFWVDLIGDGDSRKLFNLRVNIRFGCVILRHYLDEEQGSLFRALGRYNGSLGQAQYPNMVLAAWKNWEYQPQLAPSLPTSVALPAAATLVK